jgi:putative transposase
MKVLEDHIHLFVEIPPSMSVSTAFQYLKGKSSRILRRNFPWLRKFKCLWSKGKFSRSVGNVTRDVIEHYISKSQGTWDYFDVRRTYAAPQQTSLRNF